MRKLTEYAPSAAFYIFALAAQVSGFTSPTIAVLLFIVATLLLVIPTRGYLKECLGYLSNREINLHDFLQLVGVDPMDRLPPSSNKAYEAFSRLRQLARDGKIVMKGRPGFRHGAIHMMSWKPREIIPSIYWRDAGISSLNVLGNCDVSKVSTLPDDAIGNGSSDYPVYRELSIIEAGVKRHFKSQP
jgi:hypothetical protein